MINTVQNAFKTKIQYKLQYNTFTELSFEIQYCTVKYSTFGKPALLRPFGSSVTIGEIKLNR